MKIVEDIRLAIAANPQATSLIIPASRAEEFTDAVLSASTSGLKSFKENVYPLQVETFLGLKFIGCNNNKIGAVEVF